MIQILRYTPERADEWNAFVASSKNGTFLFDRNYMDYHADRFADYSLMFIRKEKLYALLPAHADGDCFCSHRGLTYGGLITHTDAQAADVCQLFRALNDYLREQGFRKVLYKAIPWIYHTYPAEEDLYALFAVCNARLVGRDIASTILANRPLKWRSGRRYGAKKAQAYGITVERSDDYAAFWQVLTDNLQARYGVQPVHSLQEMQLLKARFPQNIQLYLAQKDGETLGGTVLYVSPHIVHVQYISATPKGKEWHALDVLFQEIMFNHLPEDCCFDFGKSTEQQGHLLNESLIFQKEGFGGRGVCYDTYEWSLV